MCQISNKLKLCTCATEDPTTLKDYWILQRPHSRDEILMGMAMLPNLLSESEERFNQNTLQNLLNEGNCFDVALDHREEDTLELHLTCNTQSLVYAFKFNKGKWQLSDFDPFANHDQVKHGKVVGPFDIDPVI